MKSLSRRFLISVGLMSLVMTVLGTLGAFVVFERELSNRQIGYLTDYVRERSSNVDRRFSNLTTLHKAAEEELGRRIHHLDPERVIPLADSYFPLQADGTRRSLPKFFDGMSTGGGYVYGLGAFIGRAKDTPPEEMRALVAAFGLVSDFGQAARREYDNFYFFTPPHTRGETVLREPARRRIFADTIPPAALHGRHPARQTSRFPGRGVLDRA